MNELQSILLGDMPLLISANGYRQLMLSAFPLTPSAQVSGYTLPTYEQQSREALQKILSLLNTKQIGTAANSHADTPDINLTMDYDSRDLPDCTIAYHRVWGVVTASSRWYFSSQRMEQDLRAAEQNPSIAAHFIHVNSPGGEAWYLDRLGETLAALTKPAVVLYEMACSAAYHIACHGTKVYATTKFDFVGCIGTMVSYYDFSGYYEKLGIRLIEAKADGSDLKNKMFDDLSQGKPRQYVDEVLNPLNNQFLATVRQVRPALGKLDDKSPVLRGETFYTDAAIEVGLCDGQRTLQEAIAECHELGRQWLDDKEDKISLYNLLS